MNKHSNLGRALEGLIVFLVVLVVLETLAEGYAAYAGLSVRLRKELLLAGAAFDLLFSVEFLLRLAVSGRRGGLGAYLAREGGIVDFASSLPVLVLSTVPLAWNVFFAGKAGAFAVLGGLSLVKAAEAIRISRQLRFLRVVKILRRSGPRVGLASVFVARSVSLSAAVIVVALIGFALGMGGAALRSSGDESARLLENYLRGRKAGTVTPQSLEALLGGSDSVVFVEEGGRTIYQRMTAAAFRSTHFAGDFAVREIGSYKVTTSSRDLRKAEALVELTAFAAIIGVLLLTAVSLGSSFNRHVSGVLREMIRGFKYADHSAPVGIDAGKAEYETYQLADQYNRKWLPVKRKILEARKGGTRTDS